MYKKCRLTPSHVFGLLYELKPSAALTTQQSVCTANMPIFHYFMMIDGEIVFDGLILKRFSDGRPCFLRNDGEFVPIIME